MFNKSILTNLVYIFLQKTGYKMFSKYCDIFVYVELEAKFNNVLKKKTPALDLFRENCNWIKIKKKRKNFSNLHKIREKRYFVLWQKSPEHLLEVLSCYEINQQSRNSIMK